MADLTYLDICKALYAHPTWSHAEPDIYGEDPAQIDVHGTFNMEAVAEVLNRILAEAKAKSAPQPTQDND